MRYLLFVFCVLLTSCINKPEGGGGEQDSSLAGFSWKTTKQLPLNIVSEAGDQTAIFIYDGSKMVAAGYTPYKESVTVSSSCTELSVVTFPMPYSELFSTKSASVDMPITRVSANNSGAEVAVRSTASLNWHNYLYTEWAQWNLGGHPWSSFVSFWNTAGGPQGLSSITVYLDHPPVHNADGSVASIYHTCKDAGCSSNSESTPPSDVVTTQGGTYLFEDLFPSMGDYDMNDFVVEESSATVVSKGNKIVATELTYKINASGSGMPIAMAVYMPLAKSSDIDDVEMFIVDVDGNETPYECLNMSGMFEFHPRTNLEKSNANNVVIPIFDNVMTLLTGANGNVFFNTILNALVGKPVTIKVKVNFKNKNIAIGDFKTDVFIMPRSERGREIHVADAKYTDKMDVSLFGISDDASTDSKTFRAKNGYVWGLYLPVTGFRHSLEKINLNESYPYFSKWINSLGASHSDWYKKPSSDLVWTW